MKTINVAGIGMMSGALISALFGVESWYFTFCLGIIIVLFGLSMDHDLSGDGKKDG